MKTLPRLFAIALAVALTAPAALNAKTISFADLLARPRPAATMRIAYGKAPEQFGELFLPAGKGPHPLVVMIHGGCWLQALPGVDLMDQISADLQKRGIAVWNIDYRRVGGSGGYPATFLDVAAAMDMLKTVGPAHDLDLHKLIVVGHSAGGQLALWVAARPQLEKSSALYRSDPVRVAGVVSLAGIDDLTDYRANGPSACGGPSTIDGLVGAPSASHPDVYKDTSPAAMLPIGVRQTIVSGALDPIVPSSFGLHYAMKAKAAGDNVQALEIFGAGHFELIDPQSAAWPKIVDVISRMLK